MNKNSPITLPVAVKNLQLVDVDLWISAGKDQQSVQQCSEISTRLSLPVDIKTKRKKRCCFLCSFPWTPVRVAVKHCLFGES